MFRDNAEGFVPFEPDEGLKRVLEIHDKNGEYPWDQWHRKALNSGLGQDLARLGRQVMREAIQHGWDDALQIECGRDDDGEAMLQRALEEPEQTRQRWESLMDTDGERCPRREG